MIDECVNKRIKELMEKKDAEVDAEVCRRVENAKQILERQMREELQAKKAEMDREMAEQEVGLFILPMATFICEMLPSCSRFVLASNLVSNMLANLRASNLTSKHLPDTELYPSGITLPKWQGFLTLL